MIDKEVRKLSRAQLLLIIREQEKEISELKEYIQKLEKDIENTNITIKECGSIAEASLKLSGIFEKAQEVADQYIMSIKNIENNIKSKSLENYKNKNIILNIENENKNSNNLQEISDEFIPQFDFNQKLDINNQNQSIKENIFLNSNENQSEDIDEIQKWLREYEIKNNLKW